MLQDRATASATPLKGIPPDLLGNLEATPAVDLPTASGARHAFDGMIADRGRRNGRAPSHAHNRSIRTLTAVPKSDVPKMRVGVAESVEQIEATDRLVRKRYAWRGYTLEAFEYQSPARSNELARREITLFAADSRATLGTITLRLDGPEGLRAETTHGETVRRARAEGRRICELTRLALAEDVDSRQVLASLFGLVYTVGRVNHGVTDVFIEVNPRHVGFYCRALGFSVAADARFCERVRAPSVLLHIDVEKLEERLGLVNTHPAEEALTRYGT